MKRIAVVAVRVAVEMDDGVKGNLDVEGAVDAVYEALEGLVMDRANPIVQWQYDDWGLILDKLDWHLFEVENLDEVPQIRKRGVELY